MSKLSAGLLLYRRRGDDVEVLIAHPGGPIWARRDAGAWSLPKGAPLDDESDLFVAARREFEEETGHPPPDGAAIDLGEVRMRSGKVVHGWAIEGDLDPAGLRSMRVEVEWPPRSGRMISVPGDRPASCGPTPSRRIAGSTPPRRRSSTASCRSSRGRKVRPEPDRHRPAGRIGHMFGEFKAFLTKSNALALAIGVIIGGALGAVVNSLVNDIIMPPIGFAAGRRGLHGPQDRAQGRGRRRRGDRGRDPLGQLRPGA